MGDIVRLVSTAPPRLLVTGRLKHGLSFFGEHLIESEIAEAIAAAATSVDRNVLDYTVGVISASAGNRHCYLVETDTPVPPDRLDCFARTLDQALCASNEDYAELRHANYALCPPRIVNVAPGGFAAWMEARGKLGGQNKVPRVVAEEAEFAKIAAFFERHGFTERDQ